MKLFALPTTIDHAGPSLETTIYAIGNGVRRFAKHPEEWQKARELLSRVLQPSMRFLDGSTRSMPLPLADARSQYG